MAEQTAEQKAAEYREILTIILEAAEDCENPILFQKETAKLIRSAGIQRSK